MIRVDKTLSELWHLRGNTDDNSTYEELREESSNTAFMAINTIKKLLEENEKANKRIMELDVQLANELLLELYNEMGADADADFVLWLKVKEYCFKNKLIIED